MKEKLVAFLESGFDRAVVLCDGYEVSNVEIKLNLRTCTQFVKV